MNDTKSKETKQWTKEEILAVKSLKERSRLIAANMQLSRITKVRGLSGNANQIKGVAVSDTPYFVLSVLRYENCALCILHLWGVLPDRHIPILGR